MCIEYNIYVNMYDVSAQGVDERMINVQHYHYPTRRARDVIVTSDLDDVTVTSLPSVWPT